MELGGYVVPSYENRFQECEGGPKYSARLVLGVGSDLIHLELGTTIQRPAERKL